MKVESRYWKACPGSKQSLYWAFGGIFGPWGDHHHQKIKQFTNIENRNMSLWKPISMDLERCGGWKSINPWGDSSSNMGLKVGIEKMGSSTRFWDLSLGFQSRRHVIGGGAFSFLVGSLFSAPQTLIALYARGIYLALSISRCNGFHRNDTR